MNNVKSGIQTRIGATGKPTILTSGAREVFNQLRQAFSEASILQHFDLKYYIRIEKNVLGYTIREILSKLTSDHLISDHLTSNQGQWYLVASFSRKIIPIETCYENHDNDLLAIVEAFKTWKRYLEDCKHKLLVLTNYNNLC